MFDGSLMFWMVWMVVHGKFEGLSFNDQMAKTMSHFRGFLYTERHQTNTSPKPRKKNLNLHRTNPLFFQEIFIGTGGGRTFASSSRLEHFWCPEIDVVTLHDYDATTWEEMYQGILASHGFPFFFMCNDLV